MALPTTGLTAHFDASSSDDLYTTFVSGGPHTGTPVDGSSVAVWDHEAGANRIFKQSGAAAVPVWRSTTPLMPLPCLDFTGGQRLILTNNTNSNRPVSEVITSTAYTLLIAFYAETILSAVDNYTAAPLISDAGGYVGAFLSLSSGVPKVLAYNYDGTQDYIRLPVTAGAPHVLMMRHQSGTLYAALDGGAESSIASGTTSSLTANVLLGSGGGASSYDGRLGELAIYNTALTGTDLTDAVTYFTDKWLGPAPVTVPDVVGETVGDAGTLLVAAGLTVGTITTDVTGLVPAGQVISQSPVGGTSVAAGSAVDLVVAVAPGLVILIAGEAVKFRHDSLSIHSTLNGRDTLSGILDILDGSDPPTLNQEIVVEEDGVRIYGGSINELEYRAITSDPDASKDLMVSLSAEDFNALADRRTVTTLAAPEGSTLKDVLIVLVPELASYGVTLSATQVDGPVLPSVNFTLQTGTSILDELSKLTEFVWAIDYSKVLSMWQPGSLAAPFDITDGDQKVWGDIVIRPIASEYANRIIVRGPGNGPTENVFAWYTDGTINNFPMYLFVLQHFGQVLVDTPLETVPGEGYESVGAPGSGALWEFHEGPRYTQYLSRAAGAAPAGNPWGTVPYPLQFRVIQEMPIVVTADDLAEQAANGIVEKLVESPTGAAWWELQALADSLLVRHKSRRYTVQFSTRETGLRVGQSITMGIARRNLSGPYFITDVDTQMVGATILKRTVTANETELFQGSWRDTYKLWAANSGGGGGGGSVTVGTTVPVGGTPVPHHVQHEPGGMDPLTVDSTPSIGSLRTLGTGANQAAPGNDARFTTPALHHATHEPGGTDVLQLTTDARLLGRATAGAGAVEEITIGDNLFVSGTTLSATSRNSAFVNYSFSAVQVAPPGTNQIRFNAGYPYTAVTTVWTAIVTADGQDVYRGLLIVPTGSTLLVQDKNDHTQYAQFTTTGAPIDHTTYVEFPVVHQAHGSSISGGQLVLVQNAGAPAGAGISQLTGDVTAGPGSGSQAATIAAGAVTYAKLQDVSAASRLLGRGSASGSGDAEEIVLGTNLSMSGTTLSATGGGGGGTGTVGIVIDGGGSTITTGVKGFIEIPFAGTITGWTLLSTDASATAGSIVIDGWKDTYTNYPPTVADTIFGTKPTLSSANKNTATGLSIAVAAGDIMGFTVDSVTILTRVALTLTVAT